MCHWAVGFGHPDGYGQYVKNNSASVANYRGSEARVYFNSNFGGPYDHVNAESWSNLTNTCNDNASFRWLRALGQRT